MEETEGRDDWEEEGEMEGEKEGEWRMVRKGVKEPQAIMTLCECHVFPLVLVIHTDAGGREGGGR